MKIISVGEVLWDLIGDEEHLGGAPFNFAAHAKRLGHTVFFLSAVGEDERGERILHRMKRMALATRYVGRVKNHPTGIVTVALDGSGQPHFTIHRPAAYDFAKLDDADLKELQSQQPDWIYFGTLFQMSRQGRALVRQIIETNSPSRRFYDINLRANCYEPELIRKLMSSSTIVKLNQEESEEISRMLGFARSSLEDFCRRAARQFGLDAICVTRGSAGCVLFLEGEYVEAEGYQVPIADAVGAGDAFAAALLHGIDAGWRPAEIADFSNRVGALVASRPGAIPAWSVEEARALNVRPS